MQNKILLFTALALSIAFSCRKSPFIPEPIDVNTPVRPGLWEGKNDSKSCLVVSKDGLYLTSTGSDCANIRSFYFEEEGDRGDCQLLTSSNSDFAIKNQRVMVRGDSDEILVDIKFVLPDRAAVTLFSLNDLCEVRQLDMVWTGD